MQKYEILMSLRIFLNPESWILYPVTTGKPANRPTGKQAKGPKRNQL